MAEHGAGGTHEGRAVATDGRQKMTFGRGRRLCARCAGDNAERTRSQIRCEFGGQALALRLLVSRRASGHCAEGRDQPGQAVRAARLRVAGIFQHHEGAHAAQRETRVFRALPNRPVRPGQQHIAGAQQQHHLRTRRTGGAPDQGEIDLPRLKPGTRDAHGIGAGGFLAHERARRAAYAMHDRDGAGQQVRELGQKKRWTQIRREPLVEERPGRLVAGRQFIGQRRVDRDIALATAGCDDHVGPVQQFGLLCHARVREGQAGGVGADALPGFHLPLIALFGNLQIEIHRAERMDRMGGKAGLVQRRLRSGRICQAFPMGIRPLAQRGKQADSGDPDIPVAWRRAHTASASFIPISAARSRMSCASSGAGKSMVRNLRLESATFLPAQAMEARVSV